MNQQLTAISTGINDLPSNIAKSLANIKTSPPVKPESPPSDPEPKFPTLDQFDFRDYKEVVFWKQKQYLALRKKVGHKLEGNDKDVDIPNPAINEGSFKSKEKVSVLSCFMEDKNGVQISESEKSAAREKAKAFWLKLVGKGMGPLSYDRADIDIREEYIGLMEWSFPWLRFCEDHWKAKQIWRNNITTWTKSLGGSTGKQVEKEEAKAAIEGEVIDIDTDESDVQDGQEKPSKHPQVDGKTRERKRRRVEEDTTTPPPAPATITTKRLRVRSSISPDYILR